MINVMTHLEPRHAESQEVLFLELDDVNEIVFFQKGSIDIGYEISKKKLYKLRIRKDLVVGSFYVTFDRRAMFSVKASQECSGFQIRKVKWVGILSQFPDLAKPLKSKIVEDFYTKTRRPMMTQKKRDINNMASSASDQNKLTYKEVEKSPNDYYEILMQIYQEEKDQS